MINFSNEQIPVQGSSTPQPTPQPVVIPNFSAPFTATPASPQYEKPPIIHETKKIVFIAIALMVLLAVGFTAFAYMKKVWPFTSTPKISESNFFSEILSSVAGIDSSKYTATASLNVVTRESDAKAFTVTVSNVAETRQKYQNDSTRAKNTMYILNALRDFYGTNPNPNDNVKYKKIKSTYPATLAELVLNVKTGKKAAFGIYRDPITTTDPLTNTDYEYSATSGGTNFALSVNFETQNAITTITKKEEKSPEKLSVIGQKITFTKDNSKYSWFYLPSEPPKPFFVQLSEMMRSIPPDVSAQLSAIAQSQWSQGDSADWIFNTDASGSFGDLKYKFNADALKKDKDYYFKINNIPSILSGYIGALKGTWIKIPEASTKKPADTRDYSSYSYSAVSYFAREFPDFEKHYKDYRKYLVTLLKSSAEVADSVKLISFAENPKQEKVDGQNLTRYDLIVKKEAILPFYNALSLKAESDNDLKNLELFVKDTGFKEYLESPEFNEVFDYFTANTKFTIWMDASGYPVLLQEKLRIVPPDTAVGLKDKQIDIIFKLTLSEINQALNVEVPAGARLVDDVAKESKQNEDYTYDPSGAAMIKQKLSSIRAEAEILYNKSSRNTYGYRPFLLGPCKNTASTMFAEANIWKTLGDITGGNPSLATCVATGTADNVQSYAISAPLSGGKAYSWCVDSMGTSKQIVGALKDITCK
ncbi:hypothetical protein EXS61_01955 [Candidatus Parcubacteria bacterium]|nr:hypothetical protein [Candidatus Parcubacteria bacterium]